MAAALMFAVLQTSVEAAKVAYIQRNLQRDTVKVINILQAQGHEVTVISDVVAADILTAQEFANQGYELLIVDEVINSGSVGNKFRNSPIPVINWEGYLYSGNRSAFNADTGLAGTNYPDAAAATADNGGEGGDFGQVLDETAINIIDPAHPLAAGLPAGLVDVFDPNSPPVGTEGTGVITFAGARTFIEGVEVAATVPGFANGYSVFGVDAGVQNADGTTTQARWVHLPWNDSVEGRVMIEPSFFLFEAGVAWALGLPQPVKIYDLLPEGGGFLSTDTAISFSVDKVTASGSAVGQGDIHLTLNGVDVIAGATISDAGAQWDVNYTEPLEANRIYTIIASATSADGGFGARLIHLDTFDPNSYSIEAEDFNFDSGMFFDSIVLCYPAVVGEVEDNCYFDRVGVQGIDKNEINMVTAGIPTTNEVYRYGSGFDREEFTDTFITGDSLVRQKYVDAGLPDYEVRSIVAGEWLNYTRTVPAGNYHLYARIAGGGPITIQMDLVDDGTVEQQVLTKAGRFVSAGTGGSFELVPLTDDSGQTPIVVAFDGSPQTIRMTAMSDGYAANFYMFAETTGEVNQPPTVAITGPEDGLAIAQGTQVQIAATATDDGSIVSVDFYAGTEEPLALIGSDADAPYTATYTPEALGAHTIRVVATDDGGLTGQDTITLNVIDPAVVTVSTAVGTGADLEIREHTDSASNGDSLNTRTSGNGDRNEIVALRFDLSGYTLAELSEVTLNIINFRDNSARQVALYGVAQGASGGRGTLTTESWDETSVTTFGDMPGLLVTDGDFLTQSLDVDNLTPLGQITFANNAKGTAETFADPALTDFLRNYSGSSQVTFILAAAPGYTSTGQARFASKEATALDGDAPTGEPGDFAPYLAFKVGEPTPPSVTITSPADGSSVDAGTAITINADAADDGSITGVQFFAGTAEPLDLIGESTSEPYTAQYTPTTPGAHTIRVVATDNDGLTGEASILVHVVDPSVTQVSTAAGNGADLEIREPSNDVSNGDSMNTRTSGNGDRNEVVALRFDLEGFTLAELQEVSLNIVNYRDNSAREVALYGVAQGTAGGTGLFTTEDWTESGVVVFGDMPGLLVTDGDFLTQSLNMDALTPLGQITFSSLTKGTAETFNDPALTSFLQGYTGSSLVTFILAAAPDYTSSGQARFASREATALDGGTPLGEAGDFAPYLSFRTGAAPEPMLDFNLISGSELEFTWTGGFKLQSQTNAAGINPDNSAWTDYPDGGASPVTIVIDGNNPGVYFRLISTP
ncbi:MAG TPA: Ig-like domain-containing protein [Methylomirabilota bacterium]|nr:Ig-like domain-containing protein [Methylomirabilota bacterium]